MGSRGYPSTYGGFETFVRRFAPYLVDQGVDVTVYGRDDARRGEATTDGVRVINTSGRDTTRASTLSYGLSAVRHAARERYDAALILNCANGFWLPLLRSAGIPTAVNVDGLEWERDKWSAFGKKVFHSGARVTSVYADRLIADATAIAGYWRAHFEVESTYIPYGADVLDAVEPTDVRARGLTPGRYLLVVARLVPENNIDLVLDAVRELDGRYETVVVGSGGGASPLEARLRSMTSSHRVTWLGHLADQALLEQLWQHCGLYIHGHSVGGTNPALLQALGAGSPTIVFGSVFNREVVRDAWPFFGKSSSELAAIIASLMEDEPRRRQLSAAGQEIVRQRFSWSQVCTDYLQVLDDLAGRADVPATRLARARRLAPAAR